MKFQDYFSVAPGRVGRVGLRAELSTGKIRYGFSILGECFRIKSAQKPLLDVNHFDIKRRERDQKREQEGPP